VPRKSIAAAIEHEVDQLSGLINMPSLDEMVSAKELDKRGLKIPVLIGATTSRAHTVPKASIQ
jgi:5-methyltetrahydrofolate--homocysteine methyltransferase